MIEQMLRRAAAFGALAAVLGGLALLSSRQAHADMSASYDRSNTVNGVNQKLSSSISLSAFDPPAVAWRVYHRMRNPRESLRMAAMPDAPFPSEQDREEYLQVLAALNFGQPFPKDSSKWASSLTGKAAYTYKVIRESEFSWSRGTMTGPLDGGPPPQLKPPYSPSSAVGYWVAWAVFHDVFTPEDYEAQLKRLVRPDMLYNLQGGSEAPVAYGRVQLQVDAYINAYAYGQRGFARGNLLPAVPLCEIMQANTCGITSLDPGEAQQQLLQEVRREIGKLQSTLDHSNNRAQTRIDLEVRQLRQRLEQAGIKVYGLAPSAVGAPAAKAPAAARQPSAAATWSSPEQAKIQQRMAQLRGESDRDQQCRTQLHLSAIASTWTQQQIAAHARCVMGM